MSTYGYIRVSTREQNEDRQLIALREMSVPEQNIYMDKQSGKDFNRPQYKKLVRKLKPDDMLYIKSISSGWDAIIRKFWSSGGSSPKRRK